MGSGFGSGMTGNRRLNRDGIRDVLWLVYISCCRSEWMYSGDMRFSFLAENGEGAKESLGWHSCCTISYGDVCYGGPLQAY